MGARWLAVAILAEVVATLTLRSTEGFTRPLPASIVAFGYVTAFYCLSLSLQELPIAVVYAAWAGIGTALVALLGWAVYGEALHPAAIGGIVLVALGVALVAGYSGAA
ncbi:MAG: multidrug efflux SMR transporter [Candidatus Binatia bacterium]|nr:multidrug efflux SMR transporter [Candidatus Binatia bacterium]